MHYYYKLWLIHLDLYQYCHRAVYYFKLKFRYCTTQCVLLMQFLYCFAGQSSFSLHFMSIRWVVFQSQVIGLVGCTMSGPLVILWSWSGWRINQLALFMEVMNLINLSDEEERERRRTIKTW